MSSDVQLLSSVRWVFPAFVSSVRHEREAGQKKVE